MEKQVDFTEDPAENARLWAIRKDTFPAVGAVRKTGTTVIIEDVTFPVEQLAIGVNRLIELFDKHRYDEAILFGHALEGNLHFVFTQGFNEPRKKSRATKRSWTTSRNWWPWSSAARSRPNTAPGATWRRSLSWNGAATRTQLMWQLKRLLDPNGILNPDVVLSEDPQIHLKHLKPLPAADEIVDKCIECGFCEPVVPVKRPDPEPAPAHRHLARHPGEKTRRHRHHRAGAAYQYQGIDTCAATGLCAQRCPVGINTGELVKKLRGRTSATQQRTADWIEAEHFATALQGARFTLHAANGARMLLGAPRLAKLSGALTRLPRAACLSGRSAMPQPENAIRFSAAVSDERAREWCIWRPVCRASWARRRAITSRCRCIDKTRGLLEKAGYQVVFPDRPGQSLLRPALRLQGLCRAGRRQAPADARSAAPGQSRRARSDLLRHQSVHPASGAGPRAKRVSTCTTRCVSSARTCWIGWSSRPQDAPIAVHVTCSTQHLGESQALIDLARNVQQNCGRFPKAFIAAGSPATRASPHRS